MSRVAVVLFLMVGAWFVIGAPGLPVSVEPLEPSEDIKTFAENRADKTVLRQADRAGLLKQDPDRKQQRQTVINAYKRLQRSPCDKHARRAYTDALKPFLRDGPDGLQLASENIEIEGKLYNATSYLDSAAKDTMFEALMTGTLQPEDLPGAMGMQFAVAKRFLGKTNNGSFQLPGSRCGDQN